VCVCVYIICGYVHSTERRHENYDLDPLSKSMKTTILPRCYYYYIRIQSGVCIGPICVIRPRGMCASIAATMTLFRSPPVRTRTPRMYKAIGVCAPRVYYSDFAVFRHMKFAVVYNSFTGLLLFLLVFGC
jgi:hypothetical protein